MAFEPLLGQANRSGTIMTPEVTWPAGGASRVTFRLTSSNWPATSDFMVFEIQQFRDGQWILYASGRVQEGQRSSKTGEMPSITIYPEPGDVLRVRCVITGTMRFGVEWEQA